MNAKAPQQIGRYRVIDRLGAGGMGIVYHAYDEKLRRDVAIKLLHVADHTAATQVLHEARTSSALNHPGICTVYEVEHEGDQAFIVMELVDGRPLSELGTTRRAAVRGRARVRPSGCRCHGLRAHEERHPS